MKIEIKNAESIVSDLKKFSKDLRVGIESGLDTTLDDDVESLKSTLLGLINNEITIDNKEVKTDKSAPTITMPKSKIDLVKEIFGNDIMTSDYMKTGNKGNTLDDKSNVFVMKNGRIKAWQSVSESSNYSTQESTFKNRLKDGIILDPDSGKMYKVPDSAVKGLKVECSTDSGQTLNSEKKFDAYKNSPNITRRKGDSPDQRVAVWTTRKEDINFMIRNSISVDEIIHKIQEGEYDTAAALLQKNNTSGAYKQIIENINNVKMGKIANPDTKAYINLQSLIRNLKIKKRIAEYKTDYTLFTSYDSELEDTQEKFFDVLRREIFLWKTTNEELWINVMIKSINEVVKKYNKAG